MRSVTKLVIASFDPAPGPSLSEIAPGRRTFWVRQEIRGVDFTTYVDGQLVDTWTDSSLAHGGIEAVLERLVEETAQMSQRP